MTAQKLSIFICVNLLFLKLFVGCKTKEEQVVPNLIYSKWDSYSDWKGSRDFFYKNVKTGYLAQFNSEKDLFLIYVETGAGTISLLPWVAGSNSNLYPSGISYHEDHITYSLNFQYFPNVGSASGDEGSRSFLNARKFRWVLIKPSGDPHGRKAAIDYADYEAVKKAYNIPD